MSIQLSLCSLLVLSSLVSATPLPKMRTIRRDLLVAPVQIDLGAAKDILIMSQTGIASIGSSIYGNIGVNPAAMTYITGMDLVDDDLTSYATSSQLLNGGKAFAPVAGSPAAAAGGDANTAYTTGNGQTAPGLDIYSADLNDQHFTSGIYAWTTPIVLGAGGVLTLEGKCGDVFIFQTTGEISSGALSKVVLTGGVTAASVFWIGATSLTTGAGSLWQGMNLLYTNVVVGTGATLIGGIYSQTEVAVQGATVLPPSTGTGDVITGYPNMCRQ